MSEKLCTLRTKGGGGGRYTETSLWTNPSPTSSYSGGDVTLSESVEQYKYIKIKCRVSSSNAGTFSTIYSVDDLKTFMANSVSSGCGHIAIFDSSNNRHSRGIQYKDSTTINIKVAYQDGTTTQNNANCIPIEILGLNELDHAKGFDETVLWTNSAPTSSFAKQDVTLSDDINNYDYLKFTYRVTTSVADLLSYIISVSDFKKSVENSSIHNCVLGLSTDDSVAHTRRVYYKTDTTVNFNNAYQLNAVASNNATVIPTSIVGCKFR